MKLLKDLIEHHKVILKAMEEHPDPRMLKATKMGFELELDGFSGLLEAWQEGKPLLPYYPSSTLARALGSQNVIYQDIWLFLPDLTVVPKFTQAANSMGMPDYTCDLFAPPNAAAIMGELPPTNLGVASPAMTCLLWALHEKVLAEHFNSPKLGSVPKFDIDTPNDYSEDSIKYLAAQLGELVEFTEKNVPGLKYDEDKHRELIEINRTWVNLTLKEWELKKHVPLPMSNLESSLPPFHFEPTLYGTTDKVLEFWRTRVGELEERVAKGFDKEEKLRVLWVTPPPLYIDPMDILDRLGVSVPMSVLPASRLYSGRKKAIWGDEKEFGRKLTPLEEEARIIMATGVYGRGIDWVNDVLWMCQEQNCEAIIFFQSISCIHVSGMAKLVADKAESELGIPTLLLPTKNFDSTILPPAEFESRLEEFVDMVLARKS
jgi:benzoyl-CoA reductase/2-hydroxyglutaryl-CoA dehydratase subunit BcrC/BadD/HgdB